MLRSRVGFGSRDPFKAFEGECVSRLERAALTASARAARDATDEIRRTMRGTGLGKLANALGAGSDRAKGRINRAGGTFSASGFVFARGRSARTKGALQTYTEGATIAPRRGGWLWIATPEIPKRAGRYRMTPDLYRKTGLETRIGPLVQIPGRNKGEALLVVSGVSLDKLGRPGKARRLPKRGGTGKTRTGAVSIVAFIGIRQTARSARVAPLAIVQSHSLRLPSLIDAALSEHR